MEVDGFTILELFLTRWRKVGGSMKLKSTLVVVLEIQVSLIHKQVKEINDLTFRDTSKDSLNV